MDGQLPPATEAAGVVYACTMNVLMPLPRAGFDPSESAVSWKILREHAHSVVFATPAGEPAAADPIMLTGIGLDFWSRIPLLRNIHIVGSMLRADRNARIAHAEMLPDPGFRNPFAYAQLRSADFDALLLPGGHAQGMREYLESPLLQRVVAEFFDADKPVAAICHGVVLAARSFSPRSGKSVLHGRRTTALTWELERAAWHLTRCTRWWDRDYYRTYREAPGEPRRLLECAGRSHTCFGQTRGFLRRAGIRSAALAQAQRTVPRLSA